MIQSSMMKHFLCDHSYWRRRLHPCIAVYLVGAIVLGCASLESKDRLDHLEYTVEDYGAALRWGRYNEAANLRNIRDRQPKALDLEHLKEIHVTSYVITERIVTQDQNEAFITAEIDYYNVDDPVVRKLTDKQVWWYEDGRRRWWLDGDLPAFK